MAEIVADWGRGQRCGDGAVLAAAAGMGAALGVLAIFAGWVSGPFWPQAANKHRAATIDPRDKIPAILRSRHRLKGLVGVATLLDDSFMALILMTDLQPTPLTDAEYHHVTDRLLARIESTVDEWLQNDVVDIDAHRTGGLLELSFPGGSKVVINTQPPLHELWLAARSGGFHYKFVDGVWRDTRDGRDFFDVLSACASEQAVQELKFTAAA